jgi:hypothetical protein
LDCYARLSRSHFLIKNLLRCNRAGAHCVIATHDACAEYSVWHGTLIYKLKYGKVRSRETEKGQKINQDRISPNPDDCQLRVPDREASNNLQFRLPHWELPSTQLPSHLASFPLRGIRGTPSHEFQEQRSQSNQNSGHGDSLVVFLLSESQCSPFTADTLECGGGGEGEAGKMTSQK